MRLASSAFCSCFAFSALTLAFSFPGGALRRVFLLALAIEGDAGKVAPVFDCTDENRCAARA